MALPQAESRIRHVEAAEAWHAEVEQRDVGLELGGNPQCFHPIAGDLDVVACELQPELQAFRRVEIVVGDQDTFAHGGLR